MSNIKTIILYFLWLVGWLVVLVLELYFSKYISPPKRRVEKAVPPKRDNQHHTKGGREK